MARFDAAIRELLAQENPPHATLKPWWSCGCVACDTWRASRIVPGASVMGYKQTPATKNRPVTDAHTWDLRGPFVWGSPLLTGTVALVVCELPGHVPGAHTDAVALLCPVLGLRAAAKRSLLVVQNGRDVQRYLDGG